MENEGSITNGPENSLEKSILKATVRTVGDGMLMLPMGNVCSARYVCFALRWNDNQRHPYVRMKNGCGNVPILRGVL